MIKLDLSEFFEGDVVINPKNVGITVSEGKGCFTWHAVLTLQDGTFMQTKDTIKENIDELVDVINYFNDRDNLKSENKSLYKRMAQIKQERSKDKVFTRNINPKLFPIGQKRYWEELREDALKNHRGEVVVVMNNDTAEPRFYKDFDEAIKDEKNWDEMYGPKVINGYVDYVGEESCFPEGHNKLLLSHTAIEPQ